MNEVVQNESPSAPKAHDEEDVVLSPIPRVQQSHATLTEQNWCLYFSEDLSTLLLNSEGVVYPEIGSQLEGVLRGCPEKDFHRRVDFGSVLCSVLIRPTVKEIRIASPDFWAERFLHYASGDEPEDEEQRVLLRDHVTRFQESGADSGLSDIEQITALDGLTNLHTPIARITDPIQLNALSDVEEHANLQGHALLSRQNRYRSGLMERFTRVGFDLAADYSIFRVHMLRFVAMLPYLDFDDQGTEVKRLLQETLRRTCRASRKARRMEAGERRVRPLPIVLEIMLYGARLGARLLPASWVASATRGLVKRFARMLIAGQNITEAQATLDRLAETGRDASLDQLGELVVSETEADTYLERVLVLIHGFKDSPQYGTFNSAGIPRPNVSVKMSALCAHFNPDDPEGTYEHVAPRVLEILRAAHEHQIFVNMDAEHYIYRDLNFIMLRRILLENEDLRDFPWVGLAVQAYLRDASVHLNDIIALSRTRGVTMPLRLVKGAYWDQETIEAEAHGFDAPQFLNKCETDIHFQQLCLKILENSDAVQLCVGSHNLRDHAFAHAAREVLYPDAPHVEHQVLHMTSEHLAVAMAEMGWAVRNYIPVGSLLVGMAYLVRRIMENSSQVGVLTQARRGLEPGLVLKRPADVMTRQQPTTAWSTHEAVHAQGGDYPAFANVAPARLYIPTHRASLELAIEARAADERVAPRQDPHRNGGQSECTSPSDPEHIVGVVENVSLEDVAPAIERAWSAHGEWANRPATGRAACLIRAAEILRVRRMEAAVLIAREAGKARAEALGDVDEAIDFLRFYGTEAIRLAQDPEWGHRRQSRGVVAVISPWNFPIAIACGMTSASLAGGNCVLLKPARQTALIGEYLVRLLHEAGVPRDVLQNLPGAGRTIGAALVHHDKIAGCVFTGSRAVGTWIYESMAHRVAPSVSPDGLRLPCKVIAEMGGKNAIIITANADLDEAVSGALYSSFGHSGQKCSAASRILVDQRIMGLFRKRFTRAAHDLKMGHALDPGVDVNPVIAGHEADRLMEAVVEGRAECEAVGGSIPLDRSQEWLERTGHLVGPTVLELPTSTYTDLGCLARRELFGPVVHLIPFDGLDQAIDLFNDCEYALTGGIFAQSDADIEEFLDRAECGNIYVNRPITGARVAIEPFGGFHHSGTGPKAGGSDYLKSLWPVVVRESRDDEMLDLGIPSPDPISFDEAQAVELVRPSQAAVKGDEAVARARKLSRALKQLSNDALSDENRRQAQAFLDWVEESFEGHVLGRHINRTVPGQESYNQTNQGRGAALVIGSGSTISSHSLLHALAGLVSQNSVRIAALSPELSSLWKEFAGFAQLPDLEVHDIPLSTSCADPRFTTLVFDGYAHEIASDLGGLLQFSGRAAELRSFYSLSEGPPAPDWLRLCRSHLRTRSFAINTLRHGAPLSLDFRD